MELAKRIFATSIAVLFVLSLSVQTFPFFKKIVETFKSGFIYKLVSFSQFCASNIAKAEDDFFATLLGGIQKNNRDNCIYTLSLENNVLLTVLTPKKKLRYNAFSVRSLTGIEK